MAVQIFYEYYFRHAENNLENIRDHLIENYIIDPAKNSASFRDKIDVNFLDKILGNTKFDQEKIDQEIEFFCKKNSETDLLVKQILRCAAAELKYFNEVPASVIIDEYVDIASSFFDKSKSGFVNAALDSLAKSFRQN